MASPVSLSLSYAHQVIEKHCTWLSSHKNVTDVGYGLKMKDGVFTSQQAIIVYVTKKLAAGELPKNALLPEEIDGLPVDVQDELDPTQFIIDNGGGLDLTRVRPLRSGTTISTSSAPDAGGTLGCFAARNTDQKKVLVSNYHVLFRNRGLEGTLGGDNIVYQPVEGQHNRVAVVPDGTGSIGGALDCAFAVLDQEGSCICCNHTIPHENRVGNTQLVGVASVQVDQLVYKTGAKSGSSVGKIVNISKTITGSVDYTDLFLPAGNTFNFNNLIMIVFWDVDTNNFDPSRPFSEGGDSGSIVYNSSNQIVGLHFSTNFNPANNRYYSFACHIELVETALGITIPGTRNYAVPAPGPVSPTVAALDDQISSTDILIAGTQEDNQTELQLWWEQTEPQLEQFEIGREVLNQIRLHIFEIMRLINHNREVTVAWQRNKGPAFVAAFARSVRREDYKIPREIEDITSHELAFTMVRVLTKHGSQELKNAIHTYTPWVMQLVGNLISAWDLVEAIAELDLVQVPET